MPELQAIEPIRHKVTLAGWVTDAVTKQAIAGVKIELQETSPAAFTKQLMLKALQYGDAWENLPVRPDRTGTALDGGFYFTDLPDGSYTLTAMLPGVGTRYGTVQTQSITIPEKPAGAKTKRSAKKADTTSDPSKVVLVDLALPPTALQGQITDAKPKDPKKPGVVMARVQVEGSGEAVFSDRDGSYLLVGLEAAKQASETRTITVTVLAPGYQPNQKTVAISQGQLQKLDFTLEPNQPNLNNANSNAISGVTTS